MAADELAGFRGGNCASLECETRLLARLVISGIFKSIWYDWRVHPTETLREGWGQGLLSMLNASYSVPHKHVFVEIMRSLFYTWAYFMVSQIMYCVLVTILTQQGPRYLFANECRIVCSWRAISYVRHGFVSCALCDSHSNTVKRWAGAWLNDELRWMLINLWLWHCLRRSSNWSWELELLSTVGWMTAAVFSLCDVARMQCSVRYSPMISLQRECTE